MADQSDPPPPPRPAESPPFRWQAFLQHAREPLFLLNQHRRILGVNRAWEELTQVRTAAARGLVCTPRRPPSDQGVLDAIAAALCPPAEVFDGKPARVRRLLAGSGLPRQRWDVDFLPFRDGKGRLRVLGKISRSVREERETSPPLPERLAALRERLDQRYGLEQSVSTLPAVQRVATQGRLAAGSRVPVLIVGESGSGREWVARSIHHQGESRELHFAALNCAALPPAALASGLFGEGRLLGLPGVGTLFLKEIDRLPRDLQDRLAAWLADSPAAQPRLIAATAADPAEAVRTGRLLESLHCSLATLVISVPPLRDRVADLGWLVDRLLERIGTGEDKPVRDLTPAAWEAVKAYDWPGNLRELNSVLLTAVSRTQGDRIDVADLPAVVRRNGKAAAPPLRAAPVLSLDEILERVERRLIEVALRRAQGNKSRAAELLSVWRTRLIRRVEALGIADS